MVSSRTPFGTLSIILEVLTFILLLEKVTWGCPLLLPFTGPLEKPMQADGKSHVFLLVPRCPWNISALAEVIFASRAPRPAAPSILNPPRSRQLGL